jgi:omega-6 fatty acid desaturase (delta-12 desaturase)
MVMIFFGAPVYFLILQRLPLTGPTPYSATYETWSGARGWRSVVALDAAMLAFYGGLVALLGGATVALVFLPIAILSAWAGAWLFFVQHQYEDAYWAEREEWNYAEAALLGSSHYDLPKFLHWLTGNIGLHHIHHLASRIPNYRLFECLRASEDLLKLPRLSLLESLRCARLALWDKAQRKMISFRALRRMHAAA